MPRFSFPVPGRRQKQASASAFPPPQNKVQKILGASQINVDSHATLSVADPAKDWETGSTSCISISISESTESYEDSYAGGGGGLSSLTEGEVVNSTTNRQPVFDEESGVLPREPNGLNRGFGESGGDGDTELSGHDGQSITDASSLRRKHSSSTIMSYYDKSKVPLVISQQTSSSAMAKGLPIKASSLLDIDGTMAKAAGGKKNKPAKLDLSRMFANRKASSAANLSANRGLVMGPDTVTRSPSFMSLSPVDHINRPRSSHRLAKLRPSTRGSTRDQTAGATGHWNSAQKHAPNQNRLVAQDSSAGLQNLYNHYEQMTFRDVLSEVERLEQDEPEANNEPSDSEEIQDTTVLPVSVTDMDAIGSYEDGPENCGGPHRQDLRNKRSYKDISSYLGGYGDAEIPPPQLPTTELSALKSPATDYSESISSRHTRTSKASRRTAHSLLEIDLQQTSVLSLSSDSEDDFTDNRPTTSVSVPATSPHSLMDETASSGSSYRRPATSRSSSSRKRSEKLTSHVVDHNEQFLTVPRVTSTASTIVKPPTVNSRSSSASVLTSSTAKPSTIGGRSPSLSSRMSLLSSTSMGPASYSVHEARAITLIPAQGASYNPHRDSTLSSDQLTPPLSPTSIDFMMRSNHTSMYDGDQGSVRSGHTSLSAATSNINGQGRYIAVTRQEERLLAAMRKKRLRMRESIIAEFEEEQEKGQVANNARQYNATQLSHEPQRASINAILELHAPQPQSATRNSVSFKDFPMHIDDGAFPLPPSSAHSSMGSSMVHLPISSVTSPTRVPQSSSQKRTGATQPSSSPALPPMDGRTAASSDLDRVLVYFDSSSASQNSSGGDSLLLSARAHSRSPRLDKGDVSPNLSDFVGFDGDFEERGSRESVGSYDSFNFHTPADQSPIEAMPARRHQSSEKGITTAARLRGSVSASGRFPVHIVGEPAMEMGMPVDDYGMVANDVVDADQHDIPRPDSPVEASLPMPRKKALRISAVGRVAMEVGWWGDDG